MLTLIWSLRSIILTLLQHQTVDTVLPSKNDTDVMFCLQKHQGLIIDRSLVYYYYHQDRINTQVIC